MTAPLLVFGWGNASRGDDALGPLLVQQLGAMLGGPAQARVELLEDYQLQVEHVLDLAGRERILFVDASVDAAPPFEARAVQAASDAAVSTHALSPQALLQVYRQVHGHDAPPCTLLAIRGEAFGLGEPLSAAAQGHLAAALRWARGWVEPGMDSGRHAGAGS
jgi:hydrogenase maturation protease